MSAALILPADSADSADRADVVYTETGIGYIRVMPKNRPGPAQPGHIINFVLYIYIYDIVG